MSTPFGSGPGSIAYRAIRLAGGVQSGTIPDPETLADALDECNSMLDGWNADELTQQFIDDRYFNITLSQQSYTLGPTGNFATDANAVALTYRPQRIIAANLILLSNVSQPNRIPIEIIPVESFAQIPVIAITSQVTIRMYVQTTKDNVTIWCFPYPTTGNQFEFFMWPGIAQFTSLAATFTGNPAALDAIVYGLARRMFLLLPKDKGRAAQVRGQWLQQMAAETKRLFDKSNAPSPSLVPDLSTQTGVDNGAPFDYLTGDYSQ